MLTADGKEFIEKLGRGNKAAPITYHHLTDLQKRYRMASLAFCRNLKLREEEIIDHTAEEFGITTADDNAEDIHREFLSQGEIFNREIVGTLPQGNRFVQNLIIS